MISTHKLPTAERAYDNYEITINSMPVQVNTCRVSAVPYNAVWPGHQRPKDQTELAAFLSFEIDKNDEAQISIRPAREFSEAVIRPLSKGIMPACKEGSVSFTIREHGQYTVEFDGHHNALHIFINPPEDFGIDLSDPLLTYYGPGVHKVGRIPLKNHGTLFIDKEAVVYGYIEAENLENIRIAGYGILDNSEEKRLDGEVLTLHSCCRLYDCKNVTINGVTFRDSCGWTTICFNCENVLFDNVKAVGMWRYNADGFDFINSINVVIRNCFVRSFDDAIVLKAFTQYEKLQVENYIIEGCVVWCDWGRSLEIGAETCTEIYRNIIFKDCDVIHSTHIALDIQNSGYAEVSGVVFDDIRVEYSKYCDEPAIQDDREVPYKPSATTHIPYLLNLDTHSYYLNIIAPGRKPGKIHDIVFRNIRVVSDEGMPIPQSIFRGYDKDSMTSNVFIENLVFNSEKSNNLKEANVEIYDFVEKIFLT